MPRRLFPAMIRPPQRIELILLALLGGISADASGQEIANPLSSTGAIRTLVERYCLDCHNRDQKSGGLALDDSATHPRPNMVLLEKIVRKLETGQMPPSDASQPSSAELTTAISTITTQLDDAARLHPYSGRVETLRRLTRTEYQNAIRDLLALDIDATSLLPPDEVSHGFDNITVTTLPPALLRRYVTAAQKVARLAIGNVAAGQIAETFRVRPDITQDVHLEGLPFGTRGGILIPFNFPLDGSYDVQIHLMRDRNDNIESLKEPHELEVLLDAEHLKTFTIAPPKKGQSDQDLDAQLVARIHTQAGPHRLGVTFVQQGASLLESTRQPLNVHFNFYRHPRLGPAVYEVSVTGPFEPGPPGDTPSRRQIFVAMPSSAADEDRCARQILSHLMRRAWRRPIEETELETPLQFFHDGREEGGFEAGVERALAAVLVSPHFLFRIERDPANGENEAHRISGVELASRLSFFLWSSIPDDELLEAGIQGDLFRPEGLERQVRRMLQDDRSRSLAQNFAGQWLHLRNLEAATPDMRLFPDFDDNLRQALRRETELLFEHVLRNELSVRELIRPSHTFLNERLARHYGVPFVQGSHFRPVAVQDANHRGGLLRQGSILTVTSYATRTSPVLRGKWVLENLLGTPPSPPPENVPALKDNTVSAKLSVRERLAQHRANAACASCHQRIDPPGFTLENYDAVGRWRDLEDGLPIDASGGLLSGPEVVGVDGLEQALLDRPELFVRTVVEKLLTYALGRGIEPEDGPALRAIVRRSKQNDRLSALILEITRSVPFQWRMSP